MLFTLSKIVVVEFANNVTWLACNFAFSRVNVLPSNCKLDSP